MRKEDVNFIYKVSFVLFVMGVFSASAQSSRNHATVTNNITIPPVPREFRAAWVSTVSNIDWPSRPGLSTSQQQKELLAILDKAVEINLNAIILQVRPQCDAVYDSKLEPWSSFLTGKMGKAPSPYYDPLEFAVNEAHLRGLELHVWFNPYRANHPTNRGGIADNHISKTNPAIVKKYGRYLWLDPGEKATQDHTMNVILDVVKRYDIDGVHIDDYFYPYRENDKNGRGIDFPDNPSWEKYKASGGNLSRSNWRRENVNAFVRRFYNDVKAVKPWVKVGISPFGIWRPGYPSGVTGMDQYEELYADARLWLQQGWVDYFTPQLYWKIDSIGQPYKPLLKWWVEQNKKGRHIWPGNFTSRLPGEWKAEEIVNQVKATQEQQGAGGNVHFSMVALLRNRDHICNKLRETVYRYPVLAPPCAWLSSGDFKTPPTLDVTKQGENLILKWNINSDKPVRKWILFRFQQGGWSYLIFPETPSRSTVVAMNDFNGAEILALSAVDVYSIESPLCIVDTKNIKL
ncbi:family 10 glycosylhydrolase [Candidatus Sumerlaeota bacterium]|nr:family 10 glycosylhydrolase [Candidatus Sumerlaeota bacterium]